MDSSAPPSVYTPPELIAGLPPRAPAPRELAFAFTGNAREYFSIWIVNLLLTVLTVGFYSAWAKVRRLRYLHGHTTLAGHHFGYHGDPVQILKGRLIAVAALAAFATGWQLVPDLRFPVPAAGLALLPAVVVLSMSFNLRNTSLRNLRFSFVRDFGGAYAVLFAPLAVALVIAFGLYQLIDENGAFMQGMAARREEGETLTKADLIPNLFVLSLLPLLPWFDGARVRYLVGHARYGTLRARHDAGIGRYYRLYGGTFGLFMLFAIALGAGGGALLAARRGPTADGDTAGLVGYAIAFVVLVYALGFVLFGRFQALRTNLVVGHAAFGPHRLHSRMASGRTVWIYFSNIVAAVLSLGLLLPWGKIRLLRYQLECTTLESPGFDEIGAGAHEDGSALGEELVDAFDIDLGL